jgi:hypothetical protein
MSFQLGTGGAVPTGSSGPGQMWKMRSARARPRAWIWVRPQLSVRAIAGHLTVSPPLGQWDDLGSLRDRGGLGLHRARRSRSTPS